MKLTFVAITLAMATSAFANDHLIQIRDHAGKLAREYGEITSAVKAKPFKADIVQDRLSAVNADVNRLKQLAAEFESSNQHAAKHEDWAKTKTLVDLIVMFHNEKHSVLADEPQKKRSLLKSHSEGLAKRATMLQETSARLLRNLPSGS